MVITTFISHENHLLSSLILPELTFKVTVQILSGTDSRKDVIPRFYLRKIGKDAKCQSYTLSLGALYACFLLFGGGGERGCDPARRRRTKRAPGPDACFPVKFSKLRCLRL